MACLCVAALAACSEATHEPLPSGIGGAPPLPAPEQSLLPTVNAAKAVGWESHEVPLAAEGFEVDAYARNLKHPRWLYVLPNGDVLVAETNAPDRPDDCKGIKGWIAGKVMARAGATVPSANRITLLRDANRDGRVELQVTLLDRPVVAVRHGAGGRPPVRGQLRCHRVLPVPRRRRAHRRARHRAGAAARRHHQPPLDQEPGRQRRRPHAVRRRGLEQQHRRERPGRGNRPRRDPRRGRRHRRARGSSPRACAIRSAWPGSPNRARCGRW